MVAWTVISSAVKLVGKLAFSKDANEVVSLVGRLADDSGIVLVGAMGVHWVIDWVEGKET